MGEPGKNIAITGTYYITGSIVGMLVGTMDVALTWISATVTKELDFFSFRTTNRRECKIDLSDIKVYPTEKTTRIITRAISTPVYYYDSATSSALSTT